MEQQRRHWLLASPPRAPWERKQRNKINDKVTKTSPPSEHKNKGKTKRQKEEKKIYLLNNEINFSTFLPRK